MPFLKWCLWIFLAAWPSQASVEVTPITGGYVTPLVDGATISWSGDRGYAYSVTLAGNRAFANPTNLTTGAKYTLVLTQDSTGSRVPTWGDAYHFPGGQAPTLSTYVGAVDVLSFTAGESSLSLLKITKNLYPVMSPPTDLAASTDQIGLVMLEWEDNSSDETGFEVQRNDGVGFATITTTAANATSYTDTVSEGTYPYRVRAVHRGSHSAFSGSVSGTSLPDGGGGSGGGAPGFSDE